jgi:Na+-driven multidrug efflux pump
MRKRKTVIPYVAHGNVYRKQIVTAEVKEEAKSVVKVTAGIFLVVVSLVLGFMLIMAAFGAFGGISDYRICWITGPIAIFIFIGIIVAWLRYANRRWGF